MTILNYIRGCGPNKGLGGIRGAGVTGDHVTGITGKIN